MLTFIMTITIIPFIRTVGMHLLAAFLDAKATSLSDKRMDLFSFAVSVYLLKQDVAETVTFGDSAKELLDLSKLTAL